MALVTPKITLDPTITLRPGEQLSCSASGTTPIHTALVLKRNFTVLVNTTNTVSIKLCEEGNYSCVASNQYGTDVREFVVKGERTWVI